MAGSFVIVVTLLFLSYTVFAGLNGVIAEMQAIRRNLENKSEN